MAPCELVEEPKGQWLEPGVVVLDEPERDRSRVLPSNQAAVWPFPRPQFEVKFLASSETTATVPEVVQFAAIRDPKMRMVRAIPLKVSREEQNFVVCWEEVSEFGCGETVSQALDDFSRGLIELHHELFVQNASLGPDLLAVKEVLAQHIQQR